MIYIVVTYYFYSCNIKANKLDGKIKIVIIKVNKTITLNMLKIIMRKKH